MSSLKGRKIKDTLQYILQIYDGVIYNGLGVQVSPVFSGSITAATGFTGSLTKLVSGKTFIAGGDNVTVVTSSDGQVTISAAGGSGTGDANATYIVISATSSLNAERVLTAGDGLTLVDAGANSTATFIADGTVARVSGSYFAGSITVVGTGSFEGGLSGSLTRLTDGTSYIVAGSNVVVTTGSTRQVTIASQDFTKAITVETMTDAEDITLFFTDVKLTVSKMVAIISASGPAHYAGWTVRHGDTRDTIGSEVIVGGTATSGAFATGSGEIVTVFSNPVVSANSFVWLETTGAVDIGHFNLTLKYSL